MQDIKEERWVETRDTSNTFLPVAPLRDLVLWPNTSANLLVGRPQSLNAVLQANLSYPKLIIMVLQKSHMTGDVAVDDLHEVGTLSRIIEFNKLSEDGAAYKLLVQGLSRVRLRSYQDVNSGSSERYISAQPIKFHTIFDLNSAEEIEECFQRLSQHFTDLISLSENLGKNFLKQADIDNRNIESLIDQICAEVPYSSEDKQLILETASIKTRVNLTLKMMDAAVDIIKTEHNIQARVRAQIDKNQREYYLKEQIKAIYQEMEQEDGDSLHNLESIEQKIKAAKMSKEATSKALSELRRLRAMVASSAEADVARNYIDTLISLPWAKKPLKSLDLAKVSEILRNDHYGLEKVKERIIEFIAVQNRVSLHRKKGTMHGPIICLIGPPGVGKTSIAKSIAKATERDYVRLSLGGVRDEAEIRGHRRTYIGAIPGSIIQKIQRVKSNNPVFLLDEIDKMSASDFRGDPSSAMLEVLDPEQNQAFRDHYLDVDFDLSNVFFIATANTYNIPEPLRDRMEIIYISGYTEEEKLNIVNRHLLPKIRKAHCLKASEISISKGAIEHIIRYYTAESGVRTLQKNLERICRIAISRGQDKTVIKPNNIKEFLGVKLYDYGRINKENMVGRVNGLAWTPVSDGDLIAIETTRLPGKGKIQTSGNLGRIMEESIRIAYTVARSIAENYNISLDRINSSDIHIHFPSGAISKDGPSAGIGICTAIISTLAQLKVKKNVAMTGEVSLHGEVLAIGGLKEKLLAALRAKIDTVIIPQGNVKDLSEIPAYVTDKINIIPVKNIKKVIEESILF